jgi:aryl-alcohol dehydrogenase-like predicted oxidoreductase
MNNREAPAHRLTAAISNRGMPLQEYWQTLLELKAAGKVRAVGLSNHEAAQLDAAELLGHVDTL